MKRNKQTDVRHAVRNASPQSHELSSDGIIARDEALVVVGNYFIKIYVRSLKNKAQYTVWPFKAKLIDTTFSTVFNTAYHD